MIASLPALPRLLRSVIKCIFTAARGCSRGLRRVGVPSGRLQPVYALVKRACRTYDKAARRFARAASVSDASGATVAGTPQDRIQRRALSCGFAAQDNASNRLGDALSQAQLIELRRLEDEGDRLVRDAVVELFNTVQDPIVIIRWKDIHERLEEACDALENAADVLEAILVKNR